MHHIGISSCLSVLLHGLWATQHLWIIHGHLRFSIGKPRIMSIFHVGVHEKSDALISALFWAGLHSYATNTGGRGPRTWQGHLPPLGNHCPVLFLITSEANLKILPMSSEGVASACVQKSHRKLKLCFGIRSKEHLKSFNIIEMRPCNWLAKCFFNVQTNYLFSLKWCPSCQTEHGTDSAYRKIFKAFSHVGDLCGTP